MEFFQGDIIKISGLKDKYVILSKNAFIKATGVFHVCPVLEGYPEGPVHVSIEGKKGYRGTAICEQIKLIDPSVRGCFGVDSLSYKDIMNTSDVLQGIFEYD